MRMPPINIPKWIVSAAKLKGDGFNRIALIGNHHLARIYADDCSSMGIEFIWFGDTKCIFDSFEQMEHVCLLIIFGEGSAAHLRKISSVLKCKLLGLPIVEVFDKVMLETDEPYTIKTSPIRIYNDETSHKLMQEMERIILECHPYSNLDKKDVVN